MTRNANIRNGHKRPKTQVITFSWQFPDYHPRRGEQTYFAAKLYEGFVRPLYDEDSGGYMTEGLFGVEASMAGAKQPKIHTIRGNFKLWEKRSAQVMNGDMRVSMRHWSGVPYNSKQREFLLHDYIGVQHITMCNLDTGLEAYVDGRQVDIDVIAANDGLSRADFEAWFAPHFKKSNVFDGVIIHFTEFRY